jgi:hypothetical protein
MNDWVKPGSVRDDDFEFIGALVARRLEYQPDLLAGVPVVGLGGGSFDDLLSDDPMDGVVPPDPAATALIGLGYADPELTQMLRLRQK